MVLKIVLHFFTNDMHKAFKVHKRNPPNMVVILPIIHRDLKCYHEKVDYYKQRLPRPEDLSKLRIFKVV